MKIEQITYLNDIAQTHSITQTAQRFFISQQALSVSMKKLEDEFGTIFLTRTNHGADLTQDGITFLHKARAILDMYQIIKDDLLFDRADNQSPPAGQLHILGHTRILEPLLVNIFQQYTLNYPDMTITLNEKDNIGIIDAISKNEADLGIVFVPEFFLLDDFFCSQYQNKLNQQVLFSDQFIVCCSKTHPLAQHKSLQMDSFSEIPTVLFDTSPKLFAIAGQLLPHNSHQYFTSNMSFQKAMIRKGLAISLITGFEFRKLYLKHQDLTALPLNDSPRSIIMLLTPKGVDPTTGAALFIKMLERYDFYGL